MRLFFKAISSIVLLTAKAANQINFELILSNDALQLLLYKRESHFLLPFLQYKCFIIIIIMQKSSLEMFP